MTAAAGVAPREMGWTRVLLATAAFLLLARAPGPRAILPIVDTFYLLLPVLAACFVAGWAAGGPASLAAAWVLLTVALFVPSASAGSACGEPRMLIAVMNAPTAGIEARRGGRPDGILTRLTGWGPAP